MKRAFGALAFISLLSVAPLVAAAAGRSEHLPLGIGLTDPTLAYNLTSVSDWSTEMPFLNLTESMRPWIGHDGATWNAMSYADLQSGGYLDANGWLTHMPDGLTSVGTGWDWNSSSSAWDTAAASRAGTYVLTYDGEGTLEIKGSGVKVLSSEPGKIVFENTTGGTMLMNITATDPNGTGNYLRDISVVNQKYEALYQAGEIFNPDFLSVVNDARELRFMKWMATEDINTATTWAERPQLGDASWQGQGVPVEVMVQLANQTGSDPWFSIPAGASDDYIRQFATYVRDHLNPGLVAHVEYGNENWNWSYQTTHWLGDQALATWGVSGGESWLNYAAMRATQTAVIWDQVFGAEAGTRVDNVLGVQNANSGVVKAELNPTIWQAHDPAGYVDPTTVFDSIGTTTYFGSAIVGDATLRATLLDKIRTEPAAQVQAWLTAQLTDPSVKSSIPQIEAQWAALKAVADQYGMNLTAYEGGQHVQQAFSISGLSQDDLATLTSFLTGYVRSSEMAGLYQQLWDAWTKVSDGPFMQFTDVAAPTKWGSWGTLAALGDTNVRSELLNELNQTSASWFGNGGGTQYQQGVIHIAGDTGEVLTGTAKQDFLVGGKGNDRLIPGTGRDGLNGGAGTDTVVLSGTAAQYRLVPEGKGYRLTGPGVSDYVVNVEKFAFDGGVEKTLAQMLKG